MQKKKIILFLIFAIIIIVLIFLYVFNYIYGEKQQGNKNFSEFLKNKSILQNDNILGTSISRAIYYWDEKENIFKKNTNNLLVGLDTEKENIQTNLSFDLDNDLISENYKIENGRLTVIEGFNLIWQSELNWWVDDFVIADSNNDGILDLNISVWKAGNFGSARPFWNKKNDMSVKNHFFIFNFIKDKIVPIWQSSNLEAPNCEIILLDIDGDEKNDLIVLEGNYSQNSKCEGEYVAVWKWNGWGFSNYWRSERGEFHNLKINQANIIVQNKNPL